MTRQSHAHLARAAVSLLDKYRLGPVMRAVAQEVAATHQAVDIDSLVAEIARHFLIIRGTLLAEVTSARPLSAPVMKKLATMLRYATGARVVRLDATVDPALIGGFMVQAPGIAMDASLAGSLKRLSIL